MARHGWPKMTARRREKLVWAVGLFIECCEDEIADITDWDSSPAYVCDHLSEFCDSNFWTHEWPDG